MNEIFKYEFYIGNNDKNTKQFNDRVELYAIEYFNQYFPEGYTLLHGQGTYLHDDGEFINEKTSIFIVFSNRELVELELIIATLKELCSQESIFVSCTKVNGGLY